MASTLGATVPISSKRTAYPGIDKVLAAASELVTRYTGDERIRSRALQITASVRQHPATGQPDLRNVDGIATAIYTWMVRNINYVSDPWDVERIQSPDVTMAQKAGDCDDHAILSAALLQSLGIQTGFRVVSRTGRSYDHIYSVYNSPAGWKSFDTTILKYPGYEFDERVIKKSKHVPNHMPSAGSMSGSAGTIKHGFLAEKSKRIIAIALTAGAVIIGINQAL